MDTDPSVSPDPVVADRPDRIGLVSAIAAALLILLLGAVLLVQIEVTEAAVTRSCGSVFDSAVDRSGWEQWWAADLDESDEVRPSMVRTTRCPDAVNQRVAIAAALGITALVLGAVATARRRSDRSAAASASSVGHRVARNRPHHLHARRSAHGARDHRDHRPRRGCRLDTVPLHGPTRRRSRRSHRAHPDRHPLRDRTSARPARGRPGTVRTGPIGCLVFFAPR